MLLVHIRQRSVIGILSLKSFIKGVITRVLLKIVTIVLGTLLLHVSPEVPESLSLSLGYFGLLSFFTEFGREYYLNAASSQATSSLCLTCHGAR